MKYVSDILEKLPSWREERLPPPRVNQSEVRILLHRNFRVFIVVNMLLV